MSHWSKDIIADNAIDHVANMSDRDVLNALATAGKVDVIRSTTDMDTKRDVLIDMVFDDMMDRPGPYG